MGFNRSILKDNAKDFLRNHYVFAFIISAIILVICGKDTVLSVSYNFASGVQFSITGILSLFTGVFIWLTTTIIGIIFKLFIYNPLMLGKAKYYTGGEYDTVKNILFPFTSGYYFNIVKTMFIKDLMIVLHLFLLVIPGIIKIYELSMVNYILAEHPEMNTMEILDYSKQLTSGNKMNIFVLEISFFWWYILSSLIFGFLIFFIQPYFDATYAQLYFKLKDNTPDYLYYQPEY